jgi:hypothetical protein
MQTNKDTIRHQIHQLIEISGKSSDTVLLLADAVEAINAGKKMCSTQYTYLESVKIALSILFDREREREILKAHGRYAASPENSEARNRFQELTREMLQ